MLITHIAAAALGAGVVALGAREAIAPRAAARGYGVPVAPDLPPTPYLSVKANRDVALGALLVLVAYTSPPVVVAATLGIASICPVWDAALVLRYGRPRDAVIHAATAVYALVAALFALGGH